jgi:hypothetical protein
MHRPSGGPEDLLEIALEGLPRIVTSVLTQGVGRDDAVPITLDRLGPKPDQVWLRGMVTPFAEAVADARPVCDV